MESDFPPLSYCFNRVYWGTVNESFFALYPVDVPMLQSYAKHSVMQVTEKFFLLKGISCQHTTL